MKYGWTCLLLLGINLVFAQVQDVDSYKSIVKEASRNFDADCQDDFPEERVRTMAEWEEIEAIVISWTAFPDILTEIVRAAQKECEVIILTQDPAHVHNYLSSNNVNPADNVKIEVADFNSLWIRDYGPNTVYREAVLERHFVDWIYNRVDQELDDHIAQFLADIVQVPLHCMDSEPRDLVHTGGNFMTDGMGTGFSTKIILEENGLNNSLGVSNHSEADIDALMKMSMGIHRYIKLDTLPYDHIHHMDMHMKLLDEETILIGEYPEGVADGPQIEANIEYIHENFKAPSGNPYRIVRIPMPADEGNYPPLGDYYTYTNALIVNKSILLPVYDIPEDDEAIAIWKKAMPGYTIAPITCTSIVEYLGAIHCITKEIGVRNPLWIGHAKPLQGCSNFETNIVAEVKHATGIENVSLSYWTNTNPGLMTEVEMINTSNHSYEVNIPALTGDTLFYYIEAEAVNGKLINRPMVAPEGTFVLPIAACVSSTDEALFMGKQWKVYPNPVAEMLNIELESSIWGNVQFSLTNSLGEKIIQTADVASGITLNKPIDVGALPVGIYFLTISNGEEWSTKKILINRP